VFLALLQNLCLLLALVLVFLVFIRPGTGRDEGLPEFVRELATGLCLGFLGLAVMVSPIPFSEGVMLDARSVLLSVAGLFFGLVPCAVAVLMTAGFRIMEGGAGVVPGIVVIVGVTAFGQALRHAWRGGPERLGNAGLYLFGLVVHLFMLGALWAFLPDLGPDFFRKVVPFVLVFYPLAVLALGRLMITRIEEARRIQALADSRERYRSLFANTHVPMLLMDPADGRIADANPAAVALYGWSLDELRAKRIHEIDTLDAEEVDRMLRAAMEGEGTGVEACHRRRDGCLRTVKVRSGPVPIEGRELLCAIIEDVTDERRLREALAASESRSRRLVHAVEQSPVSIVITDPSGAIEYVNPFFSKATGYSREEAMGQSTRILNSGVQPSSFYAELWGEIQAGRTWTGEFCNRKKNGEIFWEAASVSPVRDDAGAITHFVAVKQDITERKAYIAQLESARSAAEAAVRAKSAFLSVVSHELRTPLNHVLGPCEFLAEELRDPEQRKLLRLAVDAGNHLLVLVERILRFSENEGHRAPRVLAVDDAALWLDLLVQRFADDARRSGHRIRTALGDRFPTAFEVDESTLGFVAGAFIDNALRFSTPGEIRVSLVRASPDTGLLTVVDGGPGVEHPIREKLFTPFFQADMSDRRNREGLGLGLALCARHAAAAGGRVYFEPAGGGSAFAYEFPLDPEAVSDSSPASA